MRWVLAVRALYAEQDGRPLPSAFTAVGDALWLTVEGCLVHRCLTAHDNREIRAQDGEQR